MTLPLSSSSRSLCSVFRTRTLLACFGCAVWLLAKRRAIPVTAMSTIATGRRRFTSALYAESKASSMIVGATRRFHNLAPSILPFQCQMSVTEKFCKLIGGKTQKNRHRFLAILTGFKRFHCGYVLLRGNCDA